MASPRMRPNRLRGWCDLLALQWFLTLPLATLRADPKRKQANIKRLMQPMAKNDSFYFFRAITRDHRKFVPKKMLEGLLSIFLNTVSSVRSRVMEQILADPSPMRTSQRFVFLYFLLPESVIIMVSEMPLLCRS